MINGMYLSTMGGMVQTARHANTANNLANSSTTGFKPDWLLMKAIPAESEWQGHGRREIDQILEHTGGGVWTDKSISNFVQGSLIETGNPLNMAFDDAATPDHTSFFKIRRGDTEYYTRDGNFFQNSDNQLVTSEGDLVLGVDGGPIVLPTSGSLSVGEDGTISNMVGTQREVVAQVGVWRTDHPQGMEKVGDSLFDPKSVAFDQSQRNVMGGYLEGSATEPVLEMVNMIEGHRLYEANMKFLSMQDETLGLTVRQLGSIA